MKNIPESALMFTSFELFKRLLCADIKQPKTHERFVAGGLAGFVTRLLIYPLDVVKTRMVTAPTGTYKGIIDCFIKTYKADGWLGFFHGLVPSVIGVVPYLGVNFTVYESSKAIYLRDHGLKDNAKLPSIVFLTCGALGSAIGQLVVYPLSMAMTRLQAQGTDGHPPRYKGMGDCFRRILKVDGIFGLYRGIGPNFMKTIPSVAISYYVYEKVKEQMEKK